MRLAKHFFCLIGTTILSMPLVCAQTSEELTTLITNSKEVGSKQKVTATAKKGYWEISTFCAPKTTNRDCKITALLMMKEIWHKHKNIHKIRVSFHVRRNPQRYRTVWVTEANVMALDSGESAADALSLLRVVTHELGASDKVTGLHGRGEGPQLNQNGQNAQSIENAASNENIQSNQKEQSNQLIPNNQSNQTNQNNQNN